MNKETGEVSHTCLGCFSSQQRITELEEQLSDYSKVNDQLGVLDACQIIPLFNKLTAENERLKEELNAIHTHDYIEDAIRIIENCNGFDEPSSSVGAAWKIITETLTYLINREDFLFTENENLKKVVDAGNSLYDLHMFGR